MAAPHATTPLLVEIRRDYRELDPDCGELRTPGSASSPACILHLGHAGEHVGPSPTSLRWFEWPR